MEETLLMTDDEGVDLFAKAKDLFAKGDHIHALEITEDLMLVHTEAKESCLLHLEHGRMFIKLGERTENPDVAFAYMLAAVECFWEDVTISGVCAHGLYDLAKQSGLVLYYKKFLKKAKQALSLTHPDDAESVAVRTLRENLKEQWKGLESLIKNAELKIAESKTSPLKKCESKVWEAKKMPDPVNNEYKGVLRSYWLGLDVKIRRDFMKVSIAELLSFVEGVHNREGRDALEQILTSAREDRKWTFWMCRTLCSKKFSSAEECKNHLEQAHAADFKPLEKDMVKRIGKDWARKVSVGGWESLDAVAAVEMIKNPFADVKTFKSNSGWSWPLAADEERSKLLKEIKLLLVSFRDHKILSNSIRNWLIRFPVRHLGKFEVSEQTLDRFHLVATPQIICFLECHELIHIRDFLKTIKCERDDGTDLVCRAVDSFLGRTRVKEKIDFDPEFSILLLDKRLLKSNHAPFDDEGTINVFDPDNHYAKAHAQGVDIISWLVDYSSVDKIFPRPIREHNLDIWVAVLRAVQLTCRTLATKYAKRVQVLGYEAALTVVENLCMSEDERRRNLPEDQWNRYVSLLCDRCEESVPGNSLSTKSLLCAVRDVLEGASHPTYDFLDFGDCLDLIRERKSLSDDKVLESILLLKLVVTHKVLLMDSKILLIDNSRTRLLDKLTRLSVFDNPTYMLRLLKPFLLDNHFPAPKIDTRLIDLPHEITLEIFARVPKRCYPIVSCVSKDLQNLVRSREIHNIRRWFDKDAIYLCFASDASYHPLTRPWFTLCTNKDNPSEDLFVAAVVLPNDHESVKDIFAVGPEIVLVCGKYLSATKVWIFDTQSSILREAPSMPVVLGYRGTSRRQTVRVWKPIHPSKYERTLSDSNGNVRL